VLEAGYESLNAAVYGEAEWGLGGSLVLSSGLRLEARSADYDDSDGASFSPATRWRADHLSLAGELGERSGWYVTASRGYRGRGFNIGALVARGTARGSTRSTCGISRRELRHASEDGTLAAELALFHMWRESQQVDLVPG